MAPGNGSAYHAGGGGRSKAVVAAKMPSRRDTPGGGGGGGGMEQERAVQDPGLKDYVGLFSFLCPALGGCCLVLCFFGGAHVTWSCGWRCAPPPPWLGMWTLFVVWLSCRFGGVGQALDLITDFVAF